MNKEELGNKISQLRRLKNISQVEFAEMLDISESALSKIERGINFPSVNTAESIAKHFDMSIGRLLTSSGEMGKQDYIDEIFYQLRSMELCDIESIIEYIKYYNKRKEAIISEMNNK